MLAIIVISVPAAVTAANILKGNGNANEPFVAPTAAFEPALAKLLPVTALLAPVSTAAAATVAPVFAFPLSFAAFNAS